MASSLFVMWTKTIRAFCLIAIEAKDGIFSRVFPPFAAKFSKQVFGANLLSLLSSAAVNMFDGEKLKSILSATCTLASKSFYKFKPKQSSVFDSPLLGSFGLGILLTVFVSLLLLFGSKFFVILSKILPVFLSSVFSPSQGVFAVSIFLCASTFFVSRALTIFTNRREKVRPFAAHAPVFGYRLESVTVRTLANSIYCFCFSWHVFIPFDIHTHSITQKWRYNGI